MVSSCGVITILWCHYCMIISDMTWLGRYEKELGVLKDHNNKLLNDLDAALRRCPRCSFGGLGDELRTHPGKDIQIRCSFTSTNIPFCPYVYPYEIRTHPHKISNKDNHLYPFISYFIHLYIHSRYLSFISQIVILSICISIQDIYHLYLK